MRCAISCMNDFDRDNSICDFDNDDRWKTFHFRFHHFSFHHCKIAHNFHVQMICALFHNWWLKNVNCWLNQLHCLMNWRIQLSMSNDFESFVWCFYANKKISRINFLNFVVKNSCFRSILLNIWTLKNWNYSLWRRLNWWFVIWSNLFVII